MASAGTGGRVERLGAAAMRDEHLEALVAGEVDQDAGVVRVVLDDEQDRVARLDGRAVVGDLLGAAPRASAIAAAAARLDGIADIRGRARAWPSGRNRRSGGR